MSKCGERSYTRLPIKEEFKSKCPERGLGTLLPYVPFSTVVEAESHNLGPLRSKGRGQERFPVTSYRARGCRVSKYSAQYTGCA